LDVRTALADVAEAKSFKQPADFGGLENRNGTHNQAKAML
jgi:hypothetical protein